MQKDKKRSTSEFFLLLICDSVNFKQKIKVCRWFIMAVNENCNSFFFHFHWRTCGCKSETFTFMSVMFLSFEIRVGDKISRFFSDSAFCTSVCGLNGLVFYLCHILDHSLFILHRLLCMKYKLNIFPYKFPFHQLTHSCREKTKSNMYCICTMYCLFDWFVFCSPFWN